MGFCADGPFALDDREALQVCPLFGLVEAVSYTHLRAHETVLDLVCRLLLEKKKHYITNSILSTAE